MTLRPEAKGSRSFSASAGPKENKLWAQTSMIVDADVHDSKNARKKLCGKKVFRGRPRGGDNFTSLFQVLQTLVTRIAATSKSQIASDCNRNSIKSLRLRKHPLKPTLWTREPPVLCGFYSVSKAPHGSGNPPECVATLRFYCDFCGKSLRLRSCDCQSLAICDCDCVGH